MDVVIWHNPRCSKSRETLALLEARGIAPVVRKYLEDAPSAAEITAAAEAAGLSLRDMARRKEAEWKAQGLDDVDGPALAEAMSATPKLIERPVVFANGRAALGRPPEAVLALLEG
ncbi:arsenate reductase (glutaredoxin) [Rhodovulum sp. DZ06]|uniref:arsenate reductase (glutaredoxin) n=1 Tax=Rhodovulum sp. DZ06 TaxID=3425126 RepID=UPI003D32A564